MAFSIVYGTPTQMSSSSTSASVAAPAGIVSGEPLIFLFSINGTTGTVTPPSSWNVVSPFPIESTTGAGGTNMSGLHVYDKVATGSEPANYSWSWTNNIKGVLIVLRVAEGDGSDWQAETNELSESGATATHTTGTVNPAGTVWDISIFCDRATTASTWSGQTGGQVERIDAGTTGSSSCSLNVNDSNGTVASGSRSYSSTASQSVIRAVMGVLCVKVPSAAKSPVFRRDPGFGLYMR